MQVRDYSPDQSNAFLALYRACLKHYGIPAATTVQEARVVTLLDSERHMSCLLAYEDDQPLGFATWVLTFPASASLALYMKEIFVLGTARSKGVGRALFDALLHRAEAEGCSRMDWQTDVGNEQSQTFYDRIDAPKFDKITYRVSRDDFADFRKQLVRPLAK